MLQDGGLAAHDHIAAMDKDLPDVFKQICMFSTVHLANWCMEFANVDCKFVDNFDTLEEIHEDVRDDVFLD